MWTPPADEAVWTPPADEVVGQPSLYDRASAGAQSALNTVADYSSRAQNAVMGPVVGGVIKGAQGLSRAALGTEAPANMVGKAMSYLPQKIEQAGNYVAERGAQQFPNLPAVIPAAAGMFVANAPYLFQPGGRVEGTFLKPIVPTERQAAVDAALKAGVNLSRAEKTGGKFAATAENLLDKTPMGSIPLQADRAASDAQMLAYKDRLNSSMGTQRQNYDIGAQAQTDRAAREAAMNAKRDEMFKAVPDNVHIPLHQSRDLADTIMQEQADYLPTTRNPDISAIASDVQNVHAGIPDSAPPSGHVPVTETSPSGDNIYGSKYSAHPNPPATNAPLPVSPGGPGGKPYALFDYNDPNTGKSSYQIHGDAEGLGFKTTPNVPIETVNKYGLDVTGKTQKAAKLGHEPLDLPGASAPAGLEPKSNYQQLKRLRETVGTKAQESRKAGDFAKERDFLRMKTAIDSDIQNYVEGQTTPIGTMVGQEFADSYSKANAFSGAYKNLFKGDLGTAIQNAPPEKVLDSVFQKNNETAIKQFRALVGDDAFQEAKRKWVSDLLESPNVAKELSDKKIDPGTLNAILTPKEQAALSDYGSVQGIRKTVGAVQGTNGSARMTGHALSYGSLINAGHQLATGNVPGALAYGAAFALPYPAAKLLSQSANGIHVAVPGVVRNAALAQFVDRVITKKGQNQ